jgi:hypothetical protein
MICPGLQLEWTNAHGMVHAKWAAGWVKVNTTITKWLGLIRIRDQDQGRAALLWISNSALLSTSRPLLSKPGQWYNLAPYPAKI